MNRAEIKLHSREAIRNADPKGWILLLAIAIIAGVVTRIFDFIIPVAMGIPADYIAGETITSVHIAEWKLWVADFLSLVGMLLVLPLTLSFCRWSLNTARGADNDSFSIMFFGFREKRRCWQYLLMNLIFVGIGIVLYMLIAIATFLALFILALGLDYVWFALLLLLLIFIVSVIGIILAYRWRMAVFIIADNAEANCIQALKQSARMMKGRKFELFVFDLSFILWYLLIICTFGLAAPWVGSYITVANANFYRHLIGEIPAKHEALEQYPTKASFPPAEEKQTSYEAYLSGGENVSE